MTKSKLTERQEMLAESIYETVTLSTRLLSQLVDDFVENLSEADFAGEWEKFCGDEPMPEEEPIMSNDNQANTLEYHNVQVGDVVQYHGYDTGGTLTITGTSPYRDENTPLSTAPYWTVISRANPKPKDETQFGDWEIWNGNGKPPTGLVQVQRANQTRLDSEAGIKPIPANSFIWFGAWPTATIIAFRRVIEPVRGEVMLYVGDGTGFGLVFGSTKASGDTLRLALPTINGKLVTGKYTGPDGAVVTVENLS
jgi:hypothetical protein